MKKITMQDLAEKLKVSKGTIDRALHNRPDISKETKNKILKAVEELGYKPDKVARTLSHRAKKTRIGVIVQTKPEFYWDYVNSGIKAAERELSDYGIQVLHKPLEYYRNADEIVNNIESLIQTEVDGIILVPVNDALVVAKINEAVDKGIAVSTLNDDIKGTNRVFYVGSQMRQSGRLAAELTGKFLKHQGKVLIINCNIPSIVYKERLDGFIDVLNEYFQNVEVAAKYTFNYDLLENGTLDIKSIIENSGSIDAVYNADGAYLSKIGNVLKNSEKLKNVFLIGHEFSKDIQNLLEEGIIAACISQDPYAQGYYSLKYMFEYITDGCNLPFDKVYTKLDVIFRESCTSEQQKTIYL